jgi:hypothetical protein
MPESAAVRDPLRRRLGCSNPNTFFEEFNRKSNIKTKYDALKI